MDGLEILPEEYVKPFRRCLEVLKRSNIMFPSENSSFWKTNWRFLYMAPLHIMHFLSLTAYIVKIVIEGQDVFQQANVIPMWLVTAEVTVKTTLLLMKRDDLKNVVIHLGSMWRTEGLNEEQILLKKAALKRVKYTQFIFYRISLAVAWQYTMLPLVELTVRRLIFHQDVELQLAFAAIYPFEVTNIYIYLIMYAFQTYCVLRTVYVYIGVDWLLVVLTSNLTLYFMQLQEDLIKLNPRDVRKWERTGRIDECDYETLEKEITTIIKRHQEAILLTDELNEAFNKLIFTHLLFATLVICFFAVAAKASTGAAYVLNNYATIITMMMTIFVICYCSELLSAASSGIANAIDKTNWFIGSLKYQKTLQFIILRSHKPCSLKSLDYSPIGIKTFNTVLKTTWSYFSLASQMYDKRN